MSENPADTAANADQIEYWNVNSGAKWVELQERIDAQIGGFGELAMDHAQISPGEQVLDVGCGCGATSLSLAERVAPGGSVLGADISQPMLERARERAREAGFENLSFLEADAQTHDFGEAVFDLVFSRFGVMFFDDPTAAFTNLRRALKPGGRVAFACWRPVAENPWVTVPMQVLAGKLPMPEAPPPGTPGPFAFDDPVRVRGILEGAGFASLGVAVETRSVLIGGGGTLEEAVDLVMSLGPAARALQDASPEQRELAKGLLRDALAPHEGDDGVRLGGSVWIVSARNPG